MGDVSGAPRAGKTGRTIRDREESAIVGSIYDAALDPERWEHALGALSEYARTREAFIALIDPWRGGFPLIKSVHFTQEVVSDFLQRWANPERNLWMRAGTTIAPVGPCLNMDRFVSRSQLERTDHFRELLVPCHVERCVGAVLFRLPTMVAAYTTYRSARDPDIDRHEEVLLDRFMPHLKRALEIHRRLVGVAAAGRQALEALHGLDMGVVLLDGEGGVIFSNHSASEILGVGDGLTSARGRLTASAPDDQSKLAWMVGAVTRTGRRRGQTAGGTLLLARPSGKRPLSLLLAPLGDSPFDSGTRIPVAVVFVSDPERKHVEALQVLAQRYRLTPREAAVAGLVASGSALPDVADALAISASTARTHLYRIFDKAGVRRQTELVKLLLSEPGRAGAWLAG